MSASGRWLRGALWLASALCVLAGLQGLAQWQLAQQLRRDCAALLLPLARGDAPYRWQFQRRQDLVGGRVFGRCDYRVEADGLWLASASTECEIGLPLRQALDLRRFGRLVVSADSAAKLSLLVREQLEQPQLIADIGSVPAGNATIDLATLAWRDDNGAAVAAPARAAMLRLRYSGLTQPLRLAAASLQPPGPLALPAARSWRPLASDAIAPDASAATPLPLFLLPRGTRPETALWLRDGLRQTEPAAQLLPASELAALDRELADRAPHPDAPAANHRAWAGLGVAALALLLLRARPPRSPSVRAPLQAGAALAIPLFLVLGLRIGDDLDGITAGAIGVALAYALSLRRESATPAWQWLGAPNAWRMAALAPAIALALVLLCGSPGQLAGLRGPAVAVYLAWALLQQYLVNVVVADRLRLSGLMPRWSVLLAATAFALLHAPNAGLMAFTFAAGLFWTALWLRHRALLPLAASHALAACILVGNLPPKWLRSAEISLRFFL